MDFTEAMLTVVTRVESVEKFGILIVVRYKPGKMGKVWENVFFPAVCYCVMDSKQGCHASWKDLESP